MNNIYFIFINKCFLALSSGNPIDEVNKKKLFIILMNYIIYNILYIIVCHSTKLNNELKLRL